MCLSSLRTNPMMKKRKKNSLKSIYLYLLINYFRLLKGLDFTMAKGRRRSSLFRISKKARRKLTLEKKKLSLLRAQKRRERLLARKQRAEEKI